MILAILLWLVLAPITVTAFVVAAAWRDSRPASVWRQADDYLRAVDR